MEVAVVAVVIVIVVVVILSPVSHLSFYHAKTSICLVYSVTGMHGEAGVRRVEV